MWKKNWSQEGDICIWQRVMYMPVEFIMPYLKLIFFLMAGRVALCVTSKVGAVYRCWKTEAEVKAMSWCKKMDPHCPIQGTVYLILKLTSVDSGINLFTLLEFMHVCILFNNSIVLEQLLRVAHHNQEKVLCIWQFWVTWSYSQMRFKRLTGGMPPGWIGWLKSK